MVRWSDGYVTDVPYLRVFQRETTPAWLSTTAMLLGFHAPEVSRPFRYADLGCGNGLTCAIVAAAHPQAEVWGFDFNPTHIVIARRMAESAGLDNLRFVETSFADLARRPDDDLPRFDFIVSHGVLSWISPENQKLVYSIMSQRLQPGGLAYLGYNAMAGWSSMLPIRDLMRLMGEGGGKRSDTAIAEILRFIGRLKAGGARYFDGHPTVQHRLDHLQDADARYLAHEFLTDNWGPLAFADVADAMAEAKCSYVGSATLTDNIDAVSVPPGVAPILAETQDVRLRETLRDLAAATSLRRDIFCRGPLQLASAEQVRLAGSLAFISLGAPAQAEITFTLPAGEVTGRPEVYGPLLEALAKGPVTVGEAQKLGGSGERSLIETIQAFIMLVAGGHAAPWPTPPPRARRGGPAARSTWRSARRIRRATIFPGSRLHPSAARSPATGSKPWS